MVNVGFPWHYIWMNQSIDGSELYTDSLDEVVESTAEEKHVFAPYPEA